jgi:hypothetical protein
VKLKELEILIWGGVEYISVLQAIFMSSLHDKYRWLQTAFTEHFDSINESYYYDKQNNEFFSVFITDYFLTDPNSTEQFADNSNSKAELQILRERIERVEQNHASILIIPRLTIADRKQMMHDFIAQNSDMPANEKLIQIIELENGRTSLNFDSQLPDLIFQDWEHFKHNFLRQRIDSFCNLQNITLETASLWTDKKMTSMSLDLNDTKSSETGNQNKPWWKFW